VPQALSRDQKYLPSRTGAKPISSVPYDAGLMGFDNLDILTYIKPRITTVSTSVEIQGKKAMEVLFKLISGERAPKVCYVPHEICPGETL
jgi:LacI family transcriptional regulator